MNVSAHAVQVAALKAAEGHRGFAFLMEQGLGKTLVALLEFINLVKSGHVTRMLVVAPNSFKGGWRDELEKWGMQDYFDVHIYESGNDSINNWWLRKNFTKPPLLIMNFDVYRPKKIKKGRRNVYLPSAGMEYAERFKAGKDVYFVVDESIQVSTYNSLQTIGVMMTAVDTAFQRILSGKWMKQGPHDYWSQLKIIGVTISEDYYSFKGAYCRMGGFKQKQVMGAMNEDILAEKINPHVFRATKADWTDLPPKVPYIREYALTPEMKRMYKQMEEEFVLMLEDGDVVTIEAAITKYMKLAQIQTGFIFDEDKKVRMLVEPEKNPRLKLLQEIIEDEVEGKVIVVYNHKPVREMLLAKFADMNPVFIHGGMTDDEISASKKAFNEDRNCRMICITKAAKYGHTLLGDQSDPAHACGDMVFFENTYSLDDRSQLEDRPHRHGQVQEFMKYYDLVGTPIDRNAVKALQRKESIFQAFMDYITKTGRAIGSGSSS